MGDGGEGQGGFVPEALLLGYGFLGESRQLWVLEIAEINPPEAIEGHFICDILLAANGFAACLEVPIVIIAKSFCYAILIVCPGWSAAMFRDIA